MAVDLKSVLDTGLDFLKRLKVKKAKSVVGIDIGSSSIKAVQLVEKEGKAVLETYGALSLGRYADMEQGEVANLDADKLSVALTDLLKETDITTAESIFAIPAVTSLVFLLELPVALSQSKLTSIIPTEARKYIPVPISEVSLDWFVIPKREEFYEEEREEKDKHQREKTDVLVVAIPNDTIAKYREVVTAANLKSSYFEHEIFSSIRANFGRELAPILLFEFGASSVKLAIVDGGIVRAFHTINRGSKDVTKALANALEVPFSQAEKEKREVGLSGKGEKENITNIIRSSLDYIFSETNSIILQYEKKYSKIISKIVLSGGGSLLKGFEKESSEFFKSDVVVGNPFGKVEAPEFIVPTLESIGPQFAVAIGLALRKLGS